MSRPQLFTFTGLYICSICVNVSVYKHSKQLQLQLCHVVPKSDPNKRKETQMNQTCFVGLRLFTSSRNSRMLKLGASKHLYLPSLSLQGRLWGSVLKKHHREFLFLFFSPRAFSDVQERVRSLGFYASMNHLRIFPYFPTSHKVPDILIAGTTHPVPFVAEKEILAGERTVWVEYCTVKA